MAECRLGVDIGGTFTDVLIDVGGVVTSTKVLTDYQAHDRAVVEAVLAVIDKAGVRSGDIDMLIHGTTLVTNAHVKPAIRSYLEKLIASLKAVGVDSPFYVMEGPVRGNAAEPSGQ